MNNLVSVAIFHCAYDLLEEPPSLALLHLSMLDDIIEEFAASVLQNHDDFLVRLDDSVAI